MLLAACGASDQGAGTAPQARSTTSERTPTASVPTPEAASSPPNTAPASPNTAPAAEALPNLAELLAKSPASRQELARVKAVLRDDTMGPSGSIDQTRADKLAKFGERRIPLLAHLLTDEDLGLAAAGVMLHLDLVAGAPLVFASIPQSSRDVQSEVFGEFMGRLRNRKSACCTVEMHAAAVRCLEAGTDPQAGELALQAVGLSGSAADFPLLRRYMAEHRSGNHWDAKVRNAAGAALARLGDEAELAAIERTLAAPVPSTITSEQAVALAAAMDQAAFTGQRRFSLLLCRHLDDPNPQDFSDAVPPMPRYEAAHALDQIENQAPLLLADGNIKRWTAWCEQNGHEGA